MTFNSGADPVYVVSLLQSAFSFKKEECFLEDLFMPHLRDIVQQAGPLQNLEKRRTGKWGRGEGAKKKRKKLETRGDTMHF